MGTKRLGKGRVKGNTGRKGSIHTDKVAMALVQYRNTLLCEILLSLLQVDSYEILSHYLVNDTRLIVSGHITNVNENV